MNSMWPIVWTGCAFVAATLAALVLRYAMLAGLRKQTQRPGLGAWADTIQGPSLLWCVVLGLYAANDLARELSMLPARWHKGLGLLLEAAVILSLTIPLADFTSRTVGRVSGQRALGVAITGLAQTCARVSVLVVGLLVLLSTLGIQITPILTALGVGGLAVALALQDTLANLFAGMHILADRPIRVGDYVRLGADVEGFVVDVGWRSTRVRSLANNVSVLPNQAVARATITNYDLPEPRLGLGLKVSVEHTADPDQVEALLLEEVTRAVGQVPGLLRDPAPEVSLIPGFGEYSLDFTVGYNVATFVDQYPVKHELHKRILKRLRKEGLAIPVPARAVHLAGDGDTRRSTSTVHASRPAGEDLLR